MGIRFPISSSVISGWTNQSSRSPFLSFSLALSLAYRSRHRPSHPPKMHYRISRWLCVPLTPGCWNAKSDSGVEGGMRGGEGGRTREEKGTLGKVRRARSLLQRCYLTQLRYFIPLFPTISLSLLRFPAESLMLPTNYLQSQFRDRTEQSKSKLNLFKTLKLVLF